MSLPAGEHWPGSSTIDDYLASLQAGVFDELLGPDGAARAANQDLAATADLLTPTGLLARRDQVRGLIEDDGVTYGPRRGAPPRSAGGPWIPSRWCSTPRSGSGSSGASRNAARCSTCC